MVKKFKVGIMQNPKHPNKVSRRFLEKLKEAILVGICKKTVTKFKLHHNNNKHQKFPWLKIMEIKLFAVGDYVLQQGVDLVGQLTMPKL